MLARVFWFCCFSIPCPGQHHFCLHAIIHRPDLAHHTPLDTRFQSPSFCMYFFCVYIGPSPTAPEYGATSFSFASFDCTLGAQVDPTPSLWTVPFPQGRVSRELQAWGMALRKGFFTKACENIRASPLTPPLTLNGPVGSAGPRHYWNCGPLDVRVRYRRSPSPRLIHPNSLQTARGRFRLSCWF